MSDRLTQLQTCLDQLQTQFLSSVNYINTRHDFVPVADETKVVDPGAEITEGEKFTTDLNELSRDIMVKSQQIEMLIDRLPGLTTSEQDQLKKVEALETELRDVREHKKQILQKRKELLAQCNDVIMRITREKVEMEQAVEQVEG